LGTWRPSASKNIQLTQVAAPLLQVLPIPHGVAEPVHGPVPPLLPQPGKVDGEGPALAPAPLGQAGTLGQHIQQALPRPDRPNRPLRGALGDPRPQLVVHPQKARPIRRVDRKGEKVRHIPDHPVGEKRFRPSAGTGRQCPAGPAGPAPAGRSHCFGIKQRSPVGSPGPDGPDRHTAPPGHRPIVPPGQVPGPGLRSCACPAGCDSGG